MNKKQQDAILSESFGFDAAESLQKQLKKYEKQGLSPQDWREMADTEIAHLNACLEREMDRPTWGPKEESKRNEEFSGVSNPSEIWEDSRRIKRFRPIYFGAAFIGVALFALAMAVDYSIINEFWKRALANEFLEVPESLANSILFKSLQVVIAAFAVHFFLSSLKNRNQDRGEKAYVATLFALTIVMVTGFGILITKQTMPAN